MYALTMYQKEIADRLDVAVGNYIHFADSYHIYGQRIGIAKGYVNQMIERKGTGGSYWTTEEYKNIWDGK